MHKKCGGVRFSLKQDDELKCRPLTSQEIEKVEEGLVEDVEKFCYLGQKIVAKSVAAVSVLTRIRNGWVRSEFTFANQQRCGKGAKGRLYFACFIALCYMGVRLSQKT